MPISRTKPRVSRHHFLLRRPLSLLLGQPSHHRLLSRKTYRPARAAARSTLDVEPAAGDPFFSPSPITPFTKRQMLKDLRPKNGFLIICISPFSTRRSLAVHYSLLYEGPWPSLSPPRLSEVGGLTDKSRRLRLVD